ncbi:MAG: tubulin-like doman-containing protein [Gemmataceae bacterium]
MREPNAEPIPGYRLIEPLGSGGFGEAWKCEAPGGIHKAIKFVFGNLNSLDMDGARAEQELKALNRVKAIRHPFVLQMDRIEIVNGELVIVMELADRSLHDALEEAQAAGLVGIPRDSLLRYIRDAAEALDHMNEVYNLQHLDIKPRNLFLVSDRVKVADFGLVKDLERSNGSGILSAVTPLYAPPETFTGALSPHSDQYSLAIVYQELLTGNRPFNGKNARQLAQQHMHDDPDLRTLPEAERPIVARALQKDPNRRFPNCLAFVRALHMARPHSYSNVLVEGELGGTRGRTIRDTLENIQLEGPGGDVLEPVDLGMEMGRLNESNEAVSNLGVTVAQPATGSLRPTLLVGMGGFGRRALMELRCRLLDRFGDLDKVPLVRFLYIDSDLDAIKAAQRGPAEVAFRPHEVFHLPLQPFAHYRRRQIDQLADWLPAEKLNSMPRSLKTQGSRALGRLAFSDKYQGLLARVRKEIQIACHPDAIYQTVSQTGLALRDNVPRIYVISSGMGGASGYLVDIGYALRRLLKQINQPDGPVTNLLFCGAPDDPATPRPEQANLYATLTELNHFADPSIRFSAQYGSDAARIVDEGPAFDQVYLLAQEHRTPEARRDSLAHLGSYLFHEMTTPLGIRLDQTRLKRNALTPFRSLGTFGVWFPRGLLLRMAAREACLHLFEEWQAGGPGLSGPEQSVLDAAVARVVADPELRPEAIANRLDNMAGDYLDTPPREALTRLLVNIEEQSQQQMAQDDPGAWARQVLTRVRDWLGSGVALPGVAVIQQRRSPVTRALEAVAASLAQEWARRLGEVVDGLMEHSGRRIAVAEAAVDQLKRFCEDALQAHQNKLQQSNRTAAHQAQLDQALQNCVTGTGGWSLFGGKSKRLLRVFLDHLAAFARQALADDTSTAVLQFFAALRGKLADRYRDLQFCRQRLRGLADLMRMQMDSPDGEPENTTDTVTFSRTSGGPNGVAGWGSPNVGLSQTPLLSTEAYWESIRESSTNRVVLPDGETDLERAARRFLATLTQEHWTQIDQSIGDEVLSPRGGLLRLCLEAGDIVRHFAAPMLNQSISCLSEHLPITDVAQVEYSSELQVPQRIREYYAQAAPVIARTGKPETPPPSLAGMGSGVRRAAVGGRGVPETVPDLPPMKKKTEAPGAEGQYNFLLIPASESGKQFGDAARGILNDLHLVNVPGQADLMFCREQATLAIDDLEKLLGACRNAYYEASLLPKSSPHSRQDITDWLPLDP